MRRPRQKSPPADADEQLLKLRLGERAVAVLLPTVSAAAVHVVHAFLQPVDLLEGVVARLLHEYVCWKEGRVSSVAEWRQLQVWNEETFISHSLLVREITHL